MFARPRCHRLSLSGTGPFCYYSNIAVMCGLFWHVIAVIAGDCRGSDPCATTIAMGNARTGVNSPVDACYRLYVVAVLACYYRGVDPVATPIAVGYVRTEVVFARTRCYRLLLRGVAADSMSPPPFRPG